MKKTVYAALLILTLAGLVLTGMAFADADDDGERDAGPRAAQPGSPVRDPAAPGPARARYEAECGSCHLPYPARLLPPSDWKRILGRLDRHFGDNAELPPDLQAEVSSYLLGSAGGGERPAAEPAVAADVPLPRITQKRWFRSEHAEIPARMVTANERVRSFSNCAACHQSIRQRGFSEHAVSIPGYRRWD